MNLTKQELLDIIMLLSALESWGFSTDKVFPDYLHDRLSKSVDRLSEILLMKCAVGGGGRGAADAV